MKENHDRTNEEEPVARRPALRRWRPVIISVIGLGAAVWLLRSISFLDLRLAVERLGWTELFVGFLAYVGFVGLKAARFQALFGGTVPFRPMFGVVAAQTFWTNLLPMRTGDLSYVVLLRDKTRATGTEGASSLLVASALDLWWLFVLAGGLGVFFVSTGVRNATVVALTGLAVAGTFAGILFWSVGRLFAARATERLAKTIERVPVLGGAFGRLLREMERQTWNGSFGRAALFSALALVLRYAFQLYLLRAMFPAIRTTQGVFALVFAGLVNLLPIQGVGNVGSIELPWAWALMSVGVPQPEAIASGFALHAVVLLYAGGIGLLSPVLLRRVGKEAMR